MTYGDVPNRKSRFLVVSPHFDDGVLSCARLLIGCPDMTVLTVFGGLPVAGLPASNWDRRSGFQSGREAGQARREEDARALVRLGAQQETLGFLEIAYRTPTRVHDTRTEVRLFNAITRDLVCLLKESQPEVLVIPLGIGHPDHRLASHAAISAFLQAHCRFLLAYCDLPYSLGPGATGVASRLRKLRCLAWPWVPELDLSSEIGLETRKYEALKEYGSQEQQLLTEFAADFRQLSRAPERYFLLQWEQPVGIQKFQDGGSAACPCD
jgi:LmbE family N-acetylglucosaminyl deacetylase